MLNSKNITDPKVWMGDLLKVAMNNGNEKCGKCLTRKAILSMDVPSGTVIVPAFFDRTMKVAFEEVRAALIEKSFTLMVQEKIDTLYRQIAGMMDNLSINSIFSSIGLSLEPKLRGKI